MRIVMALTCVLCLVHVAMAGSHGIVPASISDVASVAEGDTPVRVVLVRRGTVSRWATLSGLVVPRSITTVSSEAEGRVATVPFDVGDRVVPQQTVAFLQNELLALQLERAVAHSKLKRALLEREQATRQGMAELEVARISRDLQHVRSELVQLKSDYDGKKRLNDKGMLARQELDVAKTAHEKALASKSYLEAELRTRQDLLEARDWQRDIERARAELEAARHDESMARLAVERLSVKTNVGGIVLGRLVEPGSSVRPGTEIVRLVDTSELFVDCFVDEETVGCIAPSSEVRMRIQRKDRAEEFRGQVTRVAPAKADDRVGYLVRSSISRADKPLHPGQYVLVRLLLERRRNVWTVPFAAVRRSEKGDIVFCVNSAGTVEECPVKTGLREGEVVEILDGLARSLPVVVDGGHDLSDGQKVRVVGEGVEAGS